MIKKIELHQPWFFGNEKKYLNKCINDNWVSSSGHFVDRLEKKIKKITKAKFVVPVLNGTIGLHTCMILAGVKKDDEVIVPTVTFVATINAIKYVGASPVFMDVDKYLNIDEEKTLEFILNETKYVNGKTYNKKTGKLIKALVVVHAFGNAASFEKLFKLCKKKKIKLIEDAAESLGTKYITGKFKNQYTGTIGDFGIFSFNGNKIITSGNGGVVLTNNKKNYLKANYLITQAKDDSINFIHNNIGFNYKLSNISAALALAQLEKINFFIKKKIYLRQMYIKKLKKLNGVEIMETPNHSSNNNWLNLIKVTKNQNVKEIIRKLRLKYINVRPVWLPNHLQKPFRKCQTYKITNCKKYIKNLICIPSSSSLKKNQVDKIIKTLFKCLK
jgi:perosamine synthetase